MLGVPVQEYLASLRSRLARILGSELLALYLTGSGALRDWNAETSDIDIVVICARRLAPQQRAEVVAAASHPALACPARGIELVIYRRDAVVAPNPGLEFELNLNSGPALQERVSFDSRAEPDHWFAIDLAIVRRHGIPLFGPLPETLIGSVDERQLRGALIESLRWHGAYEPTSANSVLNACRAWRYGAEHRWCSKTAAATWALQREPGAVIVADALDARRRGCGKLEAEACRGFLARIAAILAGADPVSA